MLVGERRLVLEKSPWERWPPFPSNHPWKCPPLRRSLNSSLLLFRCPWPATYERNPVRGIKGEEHGSKTLILINCLIFPREVRGALSRARILFIFRWSATEDARVFVTLNSNREGVNGENAFLLAIRRESCTVRYNSPGISKNELLMVEKRDERNEKDRVA